MSDPMDEKRLAALLAVCEHGTTSRPLLQSPFMVTLAGEPWTVATDGARLLALRNGPVMMTTADVPETLAESVGRFHAAAYAAGGAEIDVVPFREFFVGHAPAEPGACPECAGRVEEDCETCAGTGEVECECVECGGEHTHDCRACDGTGGWKCPKCSDRDRPVKVRIGSTVFDAGRLAPLMRALPDGTATLQDGGLEKMWTLAAADWFALFMPMRAFEKVDELPEYRRPETSDV